MCVCVYMTKRHEHSSRLMSTENRYTGGSNWLIFQTQLAGERSGVRIGDVHLD